MDSDPQKEAEEQLRFESMFEDEILNEPLAESDFDHIGEYLMDLQADARLLFTKARRQYGGDTWVSNEMWALYQLLNHVWDRFQVLYDSDIFPKSPK